MSAKRRKTIPRRLIAGIISAAIVLVFTVSLLILNIFLPVKYLSAYAQAGWDRPRENEMRVRFLSLDGDCTFIEFPDGKTLLIDGGKDTYSNRLKVFKAIKGGGTKKIDYIISTSCAQGRTGGLSEVVKYLEVGEIFVSQHNSLTSTTEFERFVREANSKGVSIKNADFGAGFSGENYSCTILNSRTYQDPADWTLNAIVYIECFNTGLLLLGGCTSSELTDFCKTYEETLGDSVMPNLDGVNIVKAANGGKSTFAPLFDILKPETAIISGSEATSECWADLQNYAHDKIYRTDLDGTITINIGGSGYEVQKEER